MRYLSLVLLFLAPQLYGQSTFSEVRYGNRYVIGGAPSILPLDDTTFIVANNFEWDRTSFMLRMLTKNNQMLDSAYFDTLGSSGFIGINNYSIEQFFSNRFLLHADIVDGNNLSRTKLFVFNQDLDSIKSRTLVINGYSGTYSWDILVDGNKVVVLSNLGDTATNQTYKANLALTFLDTALNFLDTVIIQDYRPQAGGYYPEMIKRYGNNYYISGRCTYWNQFVESFLIKTDLQGNLIWDKRFQYLDSNGLPLNGANSLTVAFGDTIYLTSLIRTRYDGNAGYNKIWFMQLDSSGVIIRDTLYEEEQVRMAISDMIITQDGNIAFNGTFKSEYNPGDVGIFWKIDRNFNVLFKRAYHYGNENNRSMLYRLHEWPDSTFLNVGTFMYQWQNPDPSKLNYLWLLSLDKNGCLAPNNCGVLSAPEEEFWPQQTSALQVYPNPIAIGSSTDVLNLNLGGLNGQATLSLFTLQGQLLHNQALEFTQGQATFALPPGLPTGTYLITLKTKTDAYTTKVVVMRN